MHFYYPNVLWMMLIPIILLIFLIATNKNSMQLFFRADILDKLSVGGKFMNSETRNFLLFVVLILMTVSLARPVINLKEHEAKQQLTPIIVAIDVSKSMLADDIFPNRLELAKKKLKYIIQNAKNSAIGVVLFAKSSFILSPITQDFTSLLYMVEHLDTGLNFDNGSNMMAMLESGDDLTRDYEAKNIILLSDGGNKQNYDKEIDYAKENKINLYAVAIATEKGSAIPKGEGYMTNDKGEIVIVGKNKQISALAMQSGGGYIDFSLGFNDIDEILGDIYKKSKKAEFKAQKVKIYTELFYYPLALAVFILLIALSSLPRKKVLTALAMMFFIYPYDNYAAVFDFQTINKANESYKSGDYKNASDQFQSVAKNAQGYYNFANSLYKEKKYAQALKQYEKVVTSDKSLEYKKLHNMGNSFVKLNKLPKAKEFYEKALKIKKDKQIQENLDMVNKALDKKNKDQKKKQDQKNKDRNKKNDQDKKDQQSNKSKDQKKDGSDQGEKDQDKQSDKQKNKKQKEKTGEKKQTSQSSKEQKMQTISNSEEEKWMNMLGDQKTPVMLHKVKSKESSDDDIQNPW